MRYVGGLECVCALDCVQACEGHSLWSSVSCLFYSSLLPRLYTNLTFPFICNIYICLIYIIYNTHIYIYIHNTYIYTYIHIYIKVSTTLNDNPRSLETRPPWIHLVPMPNKYRGLYRGDGGEGPTNGVGTGAGAGTGLGRLQGQEEEEGVKEREEREEGEEGEGEVGWTWRSVDFEASASSPLAQAGAAAAPPTTPTPTPTPATTTTTTTTPPSTAALYAGHVSVVIASLPDHRKPVVFIAEPMSGNAGGVELPEGYLRCVCVCVCVAQAVSACACVRYVVCVLHKLLVQTHLTYLTHLTHLT